MQLSEKARKALATGLALSTFVWSFAMFASLPFASAAAHSNGCLVLSGGTVWLLENGTRRGFTSAEVFASHGYNFSQVVAANSEDTALPVGPIMTYADGTLVKGPSDPLVYLVANGQKRGFVSGSVFTGLGFSFANIQSAPVNTFSDLPTGANLESATERHTAGTLVNSGGTIWKMTATGRMGVPSMDVFNSYGYSFAKVVAANSADTSAANEGVVTARAGCSGGTTPPPVTGMLSVSLASSNPAASTVVAGQAIAHLATFALSNGSGSEAKITTLKLKRLGVSADTTLSKVYLYDGETRLTDDAAVSSGVISWNNSAGLLTVPASSVRNIAVKSNIAASTNGETVGVGVQAAADVVVSGPSVAGSFPVNGNIHTIASATLATFDLATSTTPSANTSLDPQEGFTGWQNSVSVGTRAVNLRAMNFRVIGSINYSDLKNFKLLVDGVQVGATVAQPDANGYVLFDTSASPKKLETGTRVVKVVFDVVGGSNRNFQVSLRHAADVSVTDTDFGSNILIRGDGTTTTATYAEHITGLQTVAVGTLTVSKKADSPSGNVVKTGTGVTLAKFELKALGEKMKVENLRAAVDASNAGTAIELRNGALFVDGVQVGSTAALKDINDLTAAFTEYSLGSSLIVEPGTPKTLEIRADIFDNDGTDQMTAGETLTARLAIGSSNVQRMTSAGFINVPAAVVTGNVLTITTGSIALAKDQAYGNQSVVVPASAYKIGKWTLSGSSTEAVNLDTIQVDLTFADEFAAADLTNIYVKYGSKVTSIKSASSATAGANTWSVSENFPINGTLAFEFYGDIATGAVVTETAADTVIASLLVSGTTVGSGTAVNTNSNAVLAGQTITAKLSGTLTVSLDNGTPLAAQAVAGAMSADGSLKVKLAGTNEDLYVKLVTFRVDANADDVALASLTLYSAQASGSFTQVSTTKTWNADGANPGFVTWELSGTDRVKVAKDGTSYMLLKPTYVSSDQGSVSGLTPQIVLLDLDAEGTGLLSASGTGATLINASGIVVQSNTSATYADSTADTATTALTATATTLVTDSVVFTTGDTIFVDENADATWDPATEELMTVILDGGTDLTVTRAVYGTTANAHTTGKNIYRLNNGGTTRGVVGNAQTVLKTKLSLGVASDSPSGATTGGTQKVVFKFTASAANNSADVAENKATINWVELTTTESAATVTNLSLYPSEFDQNTTYGAACGGVSTTLWRCTLVTTSGTNDVVENTSRTYVVRADVGYSGAGAVDVSIAALGTSDAAGNDVNWTDGTTTLTWVNQATTTLQGGSQTTAAASGTADTTAPTISTTAGSFAFGGTASNTLVANDTITITFTEEISAATVSSSLVPGSSVTPADAATGDVSMATTGVVTVVNIATTDVDGGVANASTYTTSVALNTAGTVLTITLSSLDTGTGALSGAEVFGDVTGLTTTITDVSGVALADSAITASGDI